MRCGSYYHSLITWCSGGVEGPFRHVNTGQLERKIQNTIIRSVVPAFSTIFDDMIGLGDDFSALLSTRKAMVKSSANHSNHQKLQYPALPSSLTEISSQKDQHQISCITEESSQ